MNDRRMNAPDLGRMPVTKAREWCTGQEFTADAVLTVVVPPGETRFVEVSVAGSPAG